MWNYLFYMMHLRSVEATEYNSNEQFVQEALDNNEETVFFPINRAMGLKNNETSGVRERPSFVFPKYENTLFFFFFFFVVVYLFWYICSQMEKRMDNMESTLKAILARLDREAERKEVERQQQVQVAPSGGAADRGDRVVHE